MVWTVLTGIKFAAVLAALVGFVGAVGDARTGIVGLWAFVTAAGVIVAVVISLAEARRGLPKGDR